MVILTFWNLFLNLDIVFIILIHLTGVKVVILTFWNLFLNLDIVFIILIGSQLMLWCMTPPPPPPSQFVSSIYKFKYIFLSFAYDVLCKKHTRPSFCIFQSFSVVLTPGMSLLYGFSYLILLNYLPRVCLKIEIKS